MPSGIHMTSLVVALCLPHLDVLGSYQSYGVALCLLVFLLQAGTLVSFLVLSLEPNSACCTANILPI